MDSSIFSSRIQGIESVITMEAGVDKLFGTDGVRGAANRPPMTAETCLALGRAAAVYFSGRHEPGARSAIVVGRDTRISGDMIQSAVAAGICSAGVDVVDAGVLPTPGVALLTRQLRAHGGIMISASHNPYTDNGIKLFDKEGYKLSDAQEARVEAFFHQSPDTGDREPGRIIPMPEATRTYRRFLENTLPSGANLRGLLVVVDCANGATYRVAPEVLTGLGATVEAVCVEPDGRNINVDCGSQHTGALRERVVKMSADLGIALDGDGDRMIAVDEQGNEVSGDRILAVCAAHLKDLGELAGDMVVSTVMSNLGLKKALEGMGVAHVETGVGDRYVLEAMRDRGAVLGGEDSGHMIFLAHHSTGDGILSAIQLMHAMRDSGRPLSDLSSIMVHYPQVLVNVAVAKKTDVATVPEIVSAVKKAEDELGSAGRVLVRYSGTRPVCRVMVEGPDRELVDRLAGDIADAVRNTLA
ncbi:MAG: phosphoglucosamine mutase [Desulfatibacillaceae bacterium]